MTWRRGKRRVLEVGCRGKPETVQVYPANKSLFLPCRQRSENGTAMCRPPACPPEAKKENKHGVPEMKNKSVDVFETDFWKNSKPGDFIVGSRLKHELTQKKLAELSGIPQTVISEYENNKRKVSRKAALQLAKALNEPAERFL